MLDSVVEEVAMYHRVSHPSLVPDGVKSNLVVWSEVALAFLAMAAIYVAFFYSIR
jgi:hypothetical protein